MSTFQDSNSKELFNEIDELRMRADESMDNISNIFLNIFYKIPEKDRDWYRLMRDFPHLVCLHKRESKVDLNVDNHSLEDSSIILPNFSMPTFSSSVIQIKLHIAKEEMVFPDFHYPPSYSLSNEIDSSPTMKICVADELGNVETLSERKQSCLDSEAKINYVEVEQTQTKSHL